MVEAGGRLGLPQDASRIGPRDLLQGNLPLESLVEGPIDGAHSSRAHAVEDSEASHDELTDHSGSSFAVGRPDPPGKPQGFVRTRACGPGPPTQGAYSRRCAHIISAFKRTVPRLELGIPRRGRRTRTRWRRRAAAPPWARSPASDHGAPRHRRWGDRSASDPDRAGDQGVPGRAEGAQLRELRPRPERDHRPGDAALERLLRSSERPRQPHPVELRGRGQGGSRQHGEPHWPGREPRHPGRARRGRRASSSWPSSCAATPSPGSPTRSPRRSATRGATRP